MNEICDKILAKDIKTLAQMITKIESTKEEDKSYIRKLFELLPRRKTNSLRLGVIGIPGVGKSSFIDHFGAKLLDSKKEASLFVLTIDPKSPLYGGSLLGDKLRMARLVEHPRAFIRPSPSNLELGSISSHIYEVLELVERSGFEYTIIESVGSGQSERHLYHLSDVLFLMDMPKTGDDIQSLKKGVLELADFILINKCDGILEDEALKKVSELKHSFLKNLDHILPYSSFRDDFSKTVLEHLDGFVAASDFQKKLLQRRETQKIYWTQQELTLLFQNYLDSHQNLFKNSQNSLKTPAKLAQDIFSKLL